jgi:hypothetical protein
MTVKIYNIGRHSLCQEWRYVRQSPLSDTTLETLARLSDPSLSKIHAESSQNQPTKLGRYKIQ